MGIFDLETGEFLRQSTHQGWRGDSAWARGLTWALYGFGTAYQFSRDVRFLQTAELCANFYIQHTPPHGVPPNDWDEPSPSHPYESSAAAIAATRGTEFERATRLFSASEAMREATGIDLRVGIGETLDQLMASVRQGLGRERFARGWQAGQRTTKVQALDEARLVFEKARM